MGDVNRKNSQLARVACPNRECGRHGKVNRGNIALHGFSKLKRGRRRRYRCKACGKTFSATTGTAYEGLQHSMRAFDRVAALSTEGVSKSAIARIERLAWNTVARWLERAARFARLFNRAKTPGFVLRELQLDEIRTFLPARKNVIWVFAAIEVWSRIWPATLVGSRSWRNTKRFVRDVFHGGRPFDYALITTDGFKFYTPAIRLVFGPMCVYGQVIKKLRKDRVVRVDTRVMIGSEWRLEEALGESEDSQKLNTAFIERLNLTIRQHSAYLNRRSPCHARSKARLEDHLELLRCYYNFGRPHGSLRFGSVTRTPAMQAGLASRKVSWREIFTARLGRSLFVVARPACQVQDRPGGEIRCAA